MVVMQTKQLDIEAIAARGRAGDAAYSAAPEGLRIGHIHLRVGNVEQAEQFYRGAVGLDLTRRRGGATFMSSGGYHHHVGANVWHSDGAGARDPDRAGLAWFSMEAADSAALDAATARLKAANAAGERNSRRHRDRRSLGHPRPLREGLMPAADPAARRSRRLTCRRAARCSASTSAPRPSASRPPIPTGGLRPASKPSPARTSPPMPRGCWRWRRSASAVGFVLGLPINMDGSEGPRAQSTRAFARNLAKLTELPIALWDERLSTAAVERELIAADVSRAKRAAVIDQHAAVFILQGALDRLSRIEK